jgi:preprotein translocase subunit SecA
VHEQVQGPLDYAIVDEVDSILIDEARTPLIISGAAHDDAPKYRAADVVARKVIELNKPWDDIDARSTGQARHQGRAGRRGQGRDEGSKGNARQRRPSARSSSRAEREEGRRHAVLRDGAGPQVGHLTHEGIAAAQDAAGVGSFYVGNNMEWPHLMEQSLRAHVVYEKDKDYVVERGREGQMEVVIVDEYTGRRWSGGSGPTGCTRRSRPKERVRSRPRRRRWRPITLQNFFNLYKDLAGMTGTAMTEAEEFTKIYDLEVVTIPTNRPCIRRDHEDRVYRTEREKWDAIIEEIKMTSDAGRPILVGTTSVEKSEMLSKMLTQKYGVKHEVLNAKVPRTRGADHRPGRAAAQKTCTARSSGT